MTGFDSDSIFYHLLEGVADMSELTKIIKERRSVRSFRSDAVPKELIDAIIEAGLYAASGMGRQSSRIIAVTNKELRDRIADENRRIGGWDAP
mgnify:CR=1 FL=1